MSADAVPISAHGEQPDRGLRDTVVSDHEIVDPRAIARQGGQPSYKLLPRAATNLTGEQAPSLADQRFRLVG